MILLYVWACVFVCAYVYCVLSQVSRGGSRSPWIRIKTNEAKLKFSVDDTHGCYEMGRIKLRTAISNATEACGVRATTEFGGL